MIDPKRTYRTRDGREVRIYAVDGFGDRPIHGAVNTEDGWRSCTWKHDGRFWGDFKKAEDDLIEVKPRHKRTVWVNVYDKESDGVVGHRGKDLADYYSPQEKKRIACIKVELDFEEGEGL